MTVIVRYLALLERWEIGIDWALGRTELADMGDGVWEGRLADGRIAEIVIDAVEPSAMALRRVSAAFGVEVADEIRSLTAEITSGSVGDIDEIERTVHFPDLSPERPTARPPLPGEAGTVIELPAAPGQPAQIVPAVEPALAVRGPVEVTVETHDTELVVRVRGVEHHDDLWVRISDGETGSLLALTRLRPAPTSTSTPTNDDSSEAVPGSGEDRAAGAVPDVVETSGALTFGLDRNLDELHVSVTDNPLARVPGRVERRANWCDELLAQARSCRLMRPGRSRALAMEALTVAASIGDAERYAAADRARRRAGLVRWGRVGLTALALGLVMWALVGWFTGPDDDGDGGIGADVVVGLDAEAGNPGEDGDAGLDGDVEVDGEAGNPGEDADAGLDGAVEVDADAGVGGDAGLDGETEVDGGSEGVGDAQLDGDPEVDGESGAEPGDAPVVFGGPATYRFDPEPDQLIRPDPEQPIPPDLNGLLAVGEIDLVLVGNPIVTAGGGGTLTARITHSFPSLFSNGPGVGPTEQIREQDARRACLSAVDGNSTDNMTAAPEPQLDLLVRLRALFDPETLAGAASGASLIIAPVEIDGRPSMVRSDRAACLGTPLTTMGLTTVARFTRPPVQLELEIPSNLPPGVWAIDLLLPDGTVAEVDSPVIIGVAP